MKRGLALLAGLAIAVFAHSALGQTSSALIEAGMEDTFSAECYALGENAVTQKNYGLWDMQVHQLQTLQLSLVDSNTLEIDCHFVWVIGNSTSHQAFAVYAASGLDFPCGDVCHWTVYSDGFYLLNPATNMGTLLHQWLTGEDTWTRPG